jgi:uncharacterized RmlC-like cupin family protein
MKTVQVTPDEMGKQIARFREIRPQGTKWAGEMGIPLGAYKKMTAEEFYLLMSAPDLGGPFASDPAVSYEQNMVVAIVKCSPGQGPYLHAHYNTFENFMVLTGQFEILWGDEGEHRTVLDPYDMIAVPKGVVRTFRNCSDGEAMILGFIRGDSPEAFADVAMTPAAAEDLEATFGKAAREQIEAIGWRFDAGVE